MKLLLSSNKSIHINIKDNFIILIVLYVVYYVKCMFELIYLNLFIGINFEILYNYFIKKKTGYEIFLYIIFITFLL